MNRRNFLQGMLIACAAPAIVRVESLMRIVPMETGRLLTPALIVQEACRAMHSQNLAIDAFASNIIRPAMSTLADRIEQDFLRNLQYLNDIVRMDPRGNSRQ